MDASAGVSELRYPCNSRRPDAVLIRRSAHARSRRLERKRTLHERPIARSGAKSLWPTQAPITDPHRRSLIGKVNGQSGLVRNENRNKLHDDRLSDIPLDKSEIGALLAQSCYAGQRSRTMEAGQKAGQWGRSVTG